MILKLRTIIIILPTDGPEVILTTARTTKSASVIMILLIQIYEILVD